MIWVFAVLIVLVLGGVALVAAGVGAPMGEAYGDRPDAVVPTDRALGADDLRHVRLPVRLRGYDMSAVDSLVARLVREAEEREQWARPDPELAPELAPEPAQDEAPESAQSDD